MPRFSESATPLDATTDTPTGLITPDTLARLNDADWLIIAQHLGADAVLYARFSAAVTDSMASWMSAAPRANREHSQSARQSRTPVRRPRREPKPPPVDAWPVDALDVLDAAMHDHGLTVQTLATQAGFTAQWLAKVLAGQASAPTTANAERIADTLALTGTDRATVVDTARILRPYDSLSVLHRSMV